MKPLRKVHAHPALFPFALVYMDTKPPQKELPDHVHDWHEIVYVYRGAGTFFIDHAFYDMRPGDLFAIPGNTIHRALPDKENPVTSSALFFSPSLIHHFSLGESFSYLDIFHISKRRREYKIALEQEEQGKIERIIGQIHNELTEQKPGSRNAAFLLLHQLLLELNRIEKAKRKKEGAEPALPPASWINDILAFIDENIENEKLTLSLLAKQALVTPSHFSRVFKQMTGMKITDYLNTKRIIKAKELLLETDYKIAHIAERCGFKSIPHFYRVFAKYVGMPPSAYRKGR